MRLFHTSRIDPRKLTQPWHSIARQHPGRREHVVSNEDGERLFGSRDFIARTRNPALRSPVKFEPTPKNKGDIIL